jgi:hypothetical protein
VEVTTISRNVDSQHHPRADAIVYLYMEYSFLSNIGLAIGIGGLVFGIFGIIYGIREG